MPIESAVFQSSAWVVYWTAPGVGPHPPITASFIDTQRLPLGTVDFDATGSGGISSTIISYAWDFGDGSATLITTVPTTTHVYANSGTFAASLTVTDDSVPAQTATVTHSVVIATDRPPVASFTTSLAGFVVTVNGTLSSDPDGTIASYNWDFGDGATLSGTNPIATHAYAIGGTYSITLIVTDNSSSTGTATKSITLSSVPVASFKTTVSGLTASVDASASTDANPISTYAWAWAETNSLAGYTGPVNNTKYATLVPGSTAASMQCTVKVPSTGHFFVTQPHLEPDGVTESTRVSRLTSAGVLIDQMVLNGAGHGTSIAVEVSGGVEYVWVTWSQADLTTTTVDNDIVRFPWPTTLTTAGTRFDRSAITGLAIKIPGPTYRNLQFDWLNSFAVLRISSGTSDVYQQHTLSRVLAGDISSPLASIPLTQSSNFGVDGLLTSQGFCTYKNALFRYTGAPSNTVGGDSPAVGVYRWSDKSQVGTVDVSSLDVTSGSYPGGVGEPEGATLYDVDGTAPKLLMGIVTGPSGTHGYDLYTLNLTPSQGTGATGKTASHTYAAAGTYPVTLTIEDAIHQTDSQTNNVTVGSANQPPVASFKSTATNLVVQFDASASTDADGQIVSYAWDFGDGTTTTVTTPTVPHTYAGAGTFSVKLTVTDNLGAPGSKTLAVTVTSGPTATVPNWDHIVIVVEENHSYAEIIAAPYFGALISGGLNFTQSFGVGHPSEPNYYAMFSGSTQGITDDNVHWYHSANLYTQLIAGGKTFKAYSENLPSAGSTVVSTSGSGYVRKHAPWVSWQTDASLNPTGNVPGSIHRPFTEWTNSATFYAALPKVTYVIPNLLDDMHDGTTSVQVSDGDTWLKNHMDGYAQWAKANNSLLIVTTDEDDGSAGNHIYTIAYGAHVVPGSTYTTKINHYDMLGLIQDACGIPRLLGSVGKPSITSPWATVSPWTLNWSDEFNGTTVDTTVWTVDNNTSFGSGNNELEVQLASNATVSGGSLAVTARKLTTPIVVGSTSYNYSSAHLNSNGKKTFTIGPGNALKIEVRAMLPDVTHLLPAPVWLRPADGGGSYAFAGMGEVDPIEATGTTDTDNAGNTRISQTVHTHTYSPDIFSAAVWNLTDTGGVTNWHIYSAEIYSDHTLFFVDGTQTARIDATSGTSSGTTLGTTYADIFSVNRPWFMHITLGVGGNWPGTPTAATTFPAVMLIDYIRVYR